MLSATGAAVLPAWLIRTGRIRLATHLRIHADTSQRTQGERNGQSRDVPQLPAYIDKDGGTRCGLPAEVEYRYTMNSTDGPLERAKISCPRRHHFNAPIEYLTLPEQPTATTASASPPPAPTVQSAPPHARREGERP